MGPRGPILGALMNDNKLARGVYRVRRKVNGGVVDAVIGRYTGVIFIGEEVIKGE